MNLRALRPLLLAILVVTGPLAGIGNVAANPVVTKNDSASGGWSQTSVVSGSSGDITQDGSNRFELVKNSAGDSSYYDTGSVSGPLSVSGSDLQISSNSYDKGDQIDVNTGMSLLEGAHGGGASVPGGDTVFLDAGDVGGCVLNDCWRIVDRNNNELTGGTQKQVAGIAMFKDPGTGSTYYLIGDRSSPGTTTDDFLMVSASNPAGISEIVDDVDNEWSVAGIAPDSSSPSQTVWIIDTSSNNLLQLFISDTPGDDNDASIGILNTYSLPSALSDPKGLAHFTATNTFMSYDASDDQVVYFTPGGAAQTFSGTPSPAKGYAGSVDRNHNGFTRAAFTLGDSSNQRFFRLADHDLTPSTSGTWTSKWFDQGYDGQDVRVNWGLEASTSQPVGNTEFTLTVTTEHPGGGTSTQTLDSTTTSGNFQHSDSLTLNNVQRIRFELTVDPGDKHPYNSIVAPSRGFDAEFYDDGGADEGQIRAHRQGGTISQGIDFGNVYDHKWWNFSVNRQSIEGSDDSQLQFEAVNGAGQTVCTISDLESNSNLNISPTGDCDVDESNADNQNIRFDFTFSSGGLSTSELTSWSAKYEERGPDPNITSYEAVVGEGNTLVENDTTVTSEIGSDDTFRIESVNQSIDSVTWYLNGQQVQQDNSPGNPPYSFSHTWASDETGINTVTGEVFNQKNGTASVTWEVDVPQPSTVKLGTVDVIQGQTQVGTGDVSENVTVDFPGDSQTITTDLGTQFQVAIDTSNDNVTYDVTMSASSPIGTSTTVTGLTGDNVTEASASLPSDKVQNFDGEYSLTINVAVTNGEFSTFDVHAIYKQQISDAESTPVITSEKIASAAHRGESVTASAMVSSEITSIRQAWLRVEDPNGNVDRRAIAPGEGEFYGQTGNESVSYSEQVTFNETGTYEVTFVGQNYDELNGTSRTYVVDVSNAPPESQLTQPPTQVDANRSFRLDWSVNDPEGDTVTSTGIYLISPSGNVLKFTDDQAGSGSHTMTIGPGYATNPGLWAAKSWARDDNGGLANSSREIIEVVSLQEYTITNSSVALWDGIESSTLHAGRDVQVNADITPDVSNTLNATVYVNLETQSGTLVGELYTATSVLFTNGTKTNLTEINGGTVERSLPTSAEGDYVIEIGVVSDEGESTFRVPVTVKGITTGEIESMSLNKRDIFPPEFLTAVSTIRNNGEQTTDYKYTVEITRNGTTHFTDSVNSTTINPDDTASTGIGFSVPKTLKPGDYTVELSIASPNRTAWAPFDLTSLPITIEENRQAEVDEVDLSYNDGVVQGYVIVDNDGNVPLSNGDLRIAVIDGETEQRVGIEDMDVQAIPVGASARNQVNFNFSADRNSTYYLGIRYEENETSDDAFSQFATAPRPSMQVVDIDGPEEVIQGENATYDITVKNNGEVKVDSTSLVVELQTGQGDVVNTTGAIVDATYPGKKSTVSVTVPVEDPSLLGRSVVSVIGQAHSGDNTTQMLPREEEIFVSAPGFIISGDSSFSGLTPGESFTVTETFLVVGRPDAAIDVTLQHDDSVALISGDEEQTITSGSSVSWTFLVNEPVNGRPIRILAQSASQSKAKDIAVSTTGSTGIIGSIDQGLPDEFQDIFPPNGYLASTGWDLGVRYFIRFGVGIILVILIESFDFTDSWSFYRKHGAAGIGFIWGAWLTPVGLVILTAGYLIGVYLEGRYGLAGISG